MPAYDPKTRLETWIFVKEGKDHLDRDTFRRAQLMWTSYDGSPDRLLETVPESCMSQGGSGTRLGTRIVQPAIEGRISGFEVLDGSTSEIFKVQTL